MTRFAALIALSLLLPGAAFAKSYTLPDDNAIAVITLPDAWSNEETDDGVESTSPDDEVYVAVEVKAAKDVAAAVGEALKFLVDNEVKIDPATEKRKEMKIGGMDALDVSFTGVHEGKVNNVSVSIVIVNPEKVLILTYWASPAGEQKHAATLQAIAESIKKVGG